MEPHGQSPCLHAEVRFSRKESTPTRAHIDTDQKGKDDSRLEKWIYI